MLPAASRPIRSTGTRLLAPDGTPVSDAVARMVLAVEAFGGTVKDLAGDGVLALFGAPVAHEDDPERAIRAGLRIVSEIRGFARDVERSWAIEGFGVRVGIDTGPVVAANEKRRRTRSLPQDGQASAVSTAEPIGRRCSTGRSHARQRYS